MKKYLLAAVIINIFFGCVKYPYNTSGVVTGNDYPPLIQEDKVKVILTGEAPDLEVIGIIQVISTTSIYKIDVIVEEAKTKAREMGANVIALEGKVIMKSKTETNTNSTDSKGNKTEDKSVTVSEYPTFTFIAGRLK